MLQDIIESKSDSAILSFFLAAPPRAFSVLEVSRRLRQSYLKTAHVLNKLVSASLLKSFSRRGKKYYIINLRNPLLPEIKRQFSRDIAPYKDELFAAVRQLGDVRAAFLSGLFSGQPNLPVDILLVGRINLKKLSDFLKAAEKMMGQEINYSIMSVKEFQLRRDTFDRFIKDIFDYPHLTVLDNLSKRKR